MLDIMRCIKSKDYFHFVVFFVMSIISTTLSSCSDEELDRYNDVNSNAINFTVSDAPDSRANDLGDQNMLHFQSKTKGLSIVDMPLILTRADINSGNFKTALKGFYTYGFNSTDFKKRGTLSFKNKEYVNNGSGSFSPKTSSDTAFWSNNLAIDVLATNFTLSQIPTPSDTGVVLGTIKGGGSDDLLLAYSSNQTKSANNGSVNLFFKHLLSKINLFLGTSRKDLDITVEDAGIYNLCGNGKIYYKDGVPTIVPASVTDSMFDAEYYWQVRDGQGLQLGGYVPGNDEDCYILPLNSEPWDYDTWSIEDMEHEQIDAGKPLETYLCITGSIKTSTGIYLLGNEKSYGHLYWPFDVKLQPAHTYNCYLDVPFGLTENGDTLNLDPVEYKVGNVITSEGHTFGTCDAAVDAGETPCGMIAYVGSETGDPLYKHGLAISLKPVLNTDDEQQRYYYYKTVFQEKNTNNTFSYGILPSLPSNLHWKVPSKKQFELIFTACGGSTSDYGNLDSYLSKIDDVWQTYTWTFSSNHGKAPETGSINAEGIISLYWTNDSYIYQADGKKWTKDAWQTAFVLPIFAF